MKQIVKPRTGVTDGAGWCHRMARAVFNAPLVYGLDSATKAANATKYRHTSRKMPNVAVPVWFWHYGTYGGVTGDFGHVVIWVPGKGFLTSPWYLNHGQEWYSTIEEIERTFNAKYRFWSEDINGLRVAGPKPALPEEEDDMNYIFIQGKSGVRKGGLYAVFNGREAVFLGNIPAPVGVPTVSDATAIANLQKRITGLR